MLKHTTMIMFQFSAGFVGAEYDVPMLSRFCIVIALGWFGFLLGAIVESLEKK